MELIYTPVWFFVILQTTLLSDLQILNNIFCLLSTEHETQERTGSKVWSRRFKLKLTILTNFAEVSENFLLGFLFDEILRTFFPSEFTLFQIFQHVNFPRKPSVGEVKPRTPPVQTGVKWSSYLPHSDCSPSHLSPRQTSSVWSPPVTVDWPQPALHYSRHTHTQRSLSPPLSWPGLLSDCWNWKVLN